MVLPLLCILLFSVLCVFKNIIRCYQLLPIYECTRFAIFFLATRIKHCFCFNGFYYGKVKAFNPAVEMTGLFPKKMQVLLFCGISGAARKQSILLPVCGNSTFRLLQSLALDNNLHVDTVAYASLVKLLIPMPTVYDRASIFKN